MITVSENAQAKIDQFLKDNANVARSVRVFLREGGWGGPSLALALDESNDSDSVFEQAEVKYVIENDLMQRTGNIIIDFVVEGQSSGFTISPEKPVSGSCSIGGTCCPS